MSAKITDATPPTFESGTKVDLKVKAGLPFNIGDGLIEDVSDFQFRASGNYDVKIPFMEKLNGEGKWALTIVSNDSGENYEFEFQMMGEKTFTKSLNAAASLEDGKIVYEAEGGAQRAVQSFKKTSGGLLTGGKPQLRFEVDFSGKQVMVILQEAK